MIAEVLVSGERPKRPSAWSASMTFFWRALLKIKHVPEQLFDVFAFPIIGLLMFTYLFGGALAGSTGDYLQYVLPGILVQTVVMITMYTGVGLNTDVTKGVFDRFRALPIWRPATLVGMLLGDVVRYTIAGSMIVIVGLILGFRPDGGVLGVLAGLGLVLLFSFALAWVWTLVGLVAKTPQSVMGISMMVLFPLTFISNVFVDPETMPSWLQAFVEVNPVTLLVNAVRGCMEGDPSGGDIGIALACAAAIVAVFGPLTMRKYNQER
jgi:ABC-2 type transport system permease protein